MRTRKNYLDNIRWITLCVVILYHVFYIFNSSGVISNIGVNGIKELDTICVFTYPWIMCLLFVVSGVSAKYSLDKKTNKEFIKDRTKRILVPSIIGIEYINKIYVEHLQNKVLVELMLDMNNIKTIDVVIKREMF